MKKLLMLMTSLVAALLVAGSAACGGGDDDDSADEPTATAEATDEAEETDEPEETPEATDDDETPEPAGAADLDEYFAGMEEIGIRTDEELEAVDAELGGATYDTDEEYIAATQDGLLRVGQALETALLDASDLEPPAEAEAAHEEFLDKLQDVLIISSQLYSDIEDVATGAEMDAIGDSYGPDLTAADDAFDEACFALQDIADENGIARDIQCGDD